MLNDEARAASLRASVGRAIRPRVKMSVSEAATKYVKVKTPGGGIAPWDVSLTPYMQKPMNMLASRDHTSVIFAGPARTGKTQALVDCWFAYMAKCDPCTMQIVHMTQVTARKYSRRRIDSMHRDSDDIMMELAPGSHNNNTHEKCYLNGGVLGITWPSITNFSGDDIRFIALTDYDRFPEDIGGQGSAYHLASKRTQTFLTRGMTLVETSPGFEYLNPKWRPSKEHPHEAPPTLGALSLFNLGDRHRYYWKCPDCGDWFMPPHGPDAFSFNYNTDDNGIVDTQIIGKYGLICLCCGSIINQKHKREMNTNAIWLPEGCHIVNDKIEGEARKTKIASFWLPGAAAAYQSWDSLIKKYLEATRIYNITRSEDSLKTVYNVDFGMPYFRKNLMSDLDASDIENRSEDVVKRAVMPGVRFITASIDTQKNHFVVQVHGRGENDERWVIDRFDIRMSNRIINGERQVVEPAVYPADWDLITEQVLKKSYPLADGTGRKIGMLAVSVDAYGVAGVTEKAYKYWARLKTTGLHKKLFLIKGERPKPHIRRPRVMRVFPDNSARSSRSANARGQIPVWLLNTTMLKDKVFSDLKREERGAGYLHFPDWLDAKFYEELVTEVRGSAGWDNPSRERNESFDLLCYDDGLVLSFLSDKKIIDIDWDDPPVWADEWDKNSLVFSGGKDAPDEESAFSFSSMGESFNGDH